MDAQSRHGFPDMAVDWNPLGVQNHTDIWVSCIPDILTGVQPGIL